MTKVIMIPKLKQVRSAFMKGTEGAVKEAKKTIERMAFTTERFAKQLTPVDTGRLRSSINTSFPISTKGLTATVFTNVSYARYVHWGTSKMRARPFLTDGKAIMLNQFTEGRLASSLDKEYRKAFIKL